MRIKYNEINFDSELEVNYYNYLKENNIEFKYQNEYEKNPIKVNIGRRKNYTPDFIIYDNESKIITVVETKGWTKWSGNDDNSIMDFMTNQAKENPVFIISWLKEINGYKDGYTVNYRRIKFIKKFGFVDYDFENPNSQINKARNKIKTQKEELKELSQFKKDTIKYFKLSRKSLTEKLTTKQKEFRENYRNQIEKELNDGTK